MTITTKTKSQPAFLPNTCELEINLSKLVHERIAEHQRQQEQKKAIAVKYPPGSFQYAVACDMIDFGLDHHCNDDSSIKWYLSTIFSDS